MFSFRQPRCSRLKPSSCLLASLVVASSWAQAQQEEASSLEALAAEALERVPTTDAQEGSVEKVEPQASQTPDSSEASTTDHAERSRIVVQAQPFESEGFWMNSFYFVRHKDETWTSISEKLYGRADRASLLRRWNQKQSFEVGDILYYNSPTRPDDSTQMKVFAEDFGNALQEVVVQDGDSLSKIGHRSYGDYKSWKELSALNPEISNPDLIRVGQRIRMQPAQVETQNILNDIVKTVQQHSLASQNLVAQSEQIDQSGDLDQVEDTKEPPVQNEALADSPADETPPATAPPAMNVAQQGQEEMPEEGSTDSALSLNMQKDPHPMSFRASSLLGLLGTGLLIVSLALLLFRRSKSGSTAREPRKN